MEYPLTAYVCCKGVCVLFDILWNGASVGEAHVEKIGLYYEFRCYCNFSKRDIYRIRVSDGKSNVLLGVCVPDGNQFHLKTRIPVKKMHGETFRFTAEAQNNRGILIESGKAFAYIDKLETARLQNTNGQFNIIIDSFPNPQDSGRNPKLLRK